GIPRGAMCVQRFDDSLNSAIHITYRISLRSSSMPEPRDPLLKVLFDFALRSDAQQDSVGKVPRGPRRAAGSPPRHKGLKVWGSEVGPEPSLGNDPSAGSPTETLLRLLLP
ncbi:hypothetical protein M433DRAFT_541208, partial [Acidomyces richmondensis BFW]